MVPLKVDLHLHTRFDPLDGGTSATIDPMDLLRMAKEKGFDALSITHHDEIFKNDSVWAEAERLGILLIPGVERTIEGKHVLLYNVDEIDGIQTLKDLRRIDRERSLIIIPHPYYYAYSCMGLIKTVLKGCYDALEVSHFYTPWFNRNLPAVQYAHEEGISLIGSSDAHIPIQFGTTFSIVNANEKSIAGVFEAVKLGRVEVVTRPLTMDEVISILIKMANVQSVTRLLKWFAIKTQLLKGKFN